MYVEILHYDITTELDTNPGNIVAKVGNLVKKYAKDGRVFKQKDFACVIHIVDTDGAFIPNEYIIEDGMLDKPFYLEDGIRTCNKTGIENRNLRKRENLDRLVATKKVWKSIPYRVYYMSCNLDHVLFDKNNIGNEDKRRYSFAFAMKYKNDIPGFLEFISNSEFSVVDRYEETWEFIRKGLNSLERHSNFGICFNTEKEDNL